MISWLLLTTMNRARVHVDGAPSQPSIDKPSLSCPSRFSISNPRCQAPKAIRYVAASSHTKQHEPKNPLATAPALIHS